MFAEHCSECWAHASIQNQEDIHRIIIRTQKKSITSYPGGSRKASLKKEPLEGVLKDEKMVEEGIPSREWETVHQAEARVTKDAPGPVPLHAWNGRQRAKSSLGKQDKVTGTLMSQQDFPVVDVQSLSSAQLFAAPWTAAHQASLSSAISPSSLKLKFIESVMPSNRLILCHTLVLLPSIFPASVSFPMSLLFTSGGQSFRASSSASVLPMNIQGWFPLELTGLISLQSKGISSLLQYHTGLHCSWVNLKSLNPKSGVIQGPSQIYHEMVFNCKYCLSCLIGLKMQKTSRFRLSNWIQIHFQKNKNLLFPKIEDSSLF